MDMKLQVIAQDGFRIVIGSLFAAIVFFFMSFSFLFFVSIIVFIMSIYFYRNPERICEDISNTNVVSPVDGIVKDIIRDSNSLKIVIIKPMCFCGLLRMPFSGNFNIVSTKHGILSGDSSTGELVRVNFVDTSNSFFMSLKIYPTLFDNVNFYYNSSFVRISNRIGFLLSGKIIITLPNIDLKICVNDRLYSGITTLGYLKNEN